MGALAAELSGDVLLLVSGLGLGLATAPALRNGFRKPDAGDVNAPKPELVQGMGSHMQAEEAYEKYMTDGKVRGGGGGGGGGKEGGGPGWAVERREGGGGGPGWPDRMKRLQSSLTHPRGSGVCVGGGWGGWGVRQAHIMFAIRTEVGNS